MNTTKCCAVLLIALAINVGQSANPLMAQQGYSGYGHSGSCAGGCIHGGDDSLELIPYGRSGQAAIQSYQLRRLPPSHGHRDASGTMNYARPYRSNPTYRSPYQGSSKSPYDRGGRENYEMRREDYTYANDPGADYSRRGNHGHGACRGGCSHGGSEYDTRAYKGERQSTYDNGGQYRNEADLAPQLNIYPPQQRDNYMPNYDRSRSSQSPYSRSSANPQLQRGAGTTTQDMFSPMGPPPTSFTKPSESGSSGCGHAGCNHDHN